MTVQRVSSDARIWRRRRKLESQMRRAAAEGRWQDYRRACWRYFMSGAAKLVTAIDENREVRREGRLSVDQLRREAETINLWRDEREHVRHHVIRKPSGGVRHIMNPGIRRRVMSRMATEAMRPTLEFHPVQYGIPGCGGRHRACADLKQAIEEGFTWLTVLDLHRCFDSFKHEEALRATRLPKTVVTNAVLAKSMRLEVDHLLYDLRPPLTGLTGRYLGRSGFPQGLTSSQVLADAMIAAALARLPERDDVRVLVYADNIMVAARSKTAARSMFHALRSAFAAEARASNLSWNVVHIGRRACDGFEWLGYHFRKRHGRVEVRPTEKNHDKFGRMFWRRWKLAIVDRRERWRLRARLKSRTATFRLWDAAPEFERLMNWQINRAAKLGAQLIKAGGYAVA